MRVIPSQDERDLAAMQRQHWAAEEFEWIRRAEAPAPRAEPWRRVKGLSNRSPRALAIARELWLVRDEKARSRDKAPSRVLPTRCASSRDSRFKPRARHRSASTMARLDKVDRHINRWP